MGRLRTMLLMVGASVTVALTLALGGCGSGSGSTGRPTVGRRAGRKPIAEASPGIGWIAPITRTLGPRRVAAGVGRLPGLESAGARHCMPEKGHGEIGIFTDVPQPGCLRVTGSEPVLIVNRTGAYTTVPKSIRSWSGWGLTVLASFPNRRSGPPRWVASSPKAGTR